ncbi:hypothetical protein BD410DRAFT_453119 [Rickenella mellea]|uniref:Uncharacterized protein n=1 Tax=Rickenella mellea TaxID=50990 RepID=A0A4Y7PVD9_9AGAM|nr:hypothetical protein BD410DRAFT_453119 [Rickenella mellea]
MPPKRKYARKETEEDVSTSSKSPGKKSKTQPTRVSARLSAGNRNQSEVQAKAPMQAVDNNPEFNSAETDSKDEDTDMDSDDNGVQALINAASTAPVAYVRLEYGIYNSKYPQAFRRVADSELNHLFDTEDEDSADDQKASKSGKKSKSKASAKPKVSKSKKSGKSEETRDAEPDPEDFLSVTLHEQIGPWDKYKHATHGGIVTPNCTCTSTPPPSSSKPGKEKEAENTCAASRPNAPSLPIIMKLAFGEDDQFSLRKEYKLYLHMRQQGVPQFGLDGAQVDGSGIPKIFGLFKDTEHKLGPLGLLMANCGKRVREAKDVTDTQRNKFTGVLKAIHKARVLHGDIRKANLLVSETTGEERRLVGLLTMEEG